MTEEQIKAIQVGEPLAVRSRIGTQPPDPGAEYEVVGLPDGFKVKLKRDAEHRWRFTTSGTLGPNRKYPANGPTTKATFRSRDQALEGVRNYLRAYVGE